MKKLTGTSCADHLGEGLLADFGLPLPARLLAEMSQQEQNAASLFRWN